MLAHWYSPVWDPEITKGSGFSNPVVSRWNSCWPSPMSLTWRWQGLVRLGQLCSPKKQNNNITRMDNGPKGKRSKTASLEPYILPFHVCTVDSVLSTSWWKLSYKGCSLLFDDSSRICGSYQLLICSIPLSTVPACPLYKSCETFATWLLQIGRKSS